MKPEPSKSSASPAATANNDCLQQVFDSLHDGVTVIDADLTITQANAGMERLFQTVTSPVGQKCYDAFRGRQSQCPSCPAVSCLETGEPQTTVIQHSHNGNGTRWLKLFVSPLLDENGRPNAIVKHVKDVTEHELRIHERTNELERANRDLEAFAYTVSHDLRAPLRAIHGFSNILLEECYDHLGSEAKGYLDRIQDASKHMSELIDDLLELSRVTQTGMRRDALNLSQLAHDVIAGLREQDPGRRIEVAIAPELAGLGDQHLVRIVLENLLGNAWKFTSRKENARIEFTTAAADGTVAYCVRDNGVGFDMAFADQLFGPFRRLHSPTEFSGTGIGLATVHRIVTRHGGRVWAESREGEGATFYFTLEA